MARPSRSRRPTPRAGRESRSRGATAKSFALQIHGRYLLPAQNQRARVGLPRPVGVTERGSKLTVQADDAVELLLGEGERGAGADKHRYQVAADETPPVVDVAWRKYRPAFPVESVADVTIHERTAQVRQRLRFAAVPRGLAPAQPQTGQLQLIVPPGVRRRGGPRRRPAQKHRGGERLALGPAGAG